MDRANSHTKSYNIQRSFEAMYINIKYKLRTWVTCGVHKHFANSFNYISMVQAVIEWP